MTTINQKALELYEKRIAPYAQNISLQDKQNILELQKLIFNIDDYGERHENIEQDVLESFWQQVKAFLDSLHIPKSIHDALLQDIKDYAEIETSTRKGKKLTDYEIGFFYTKKSCDVRMQRHVIRYLNGQPATSSNEEITKDILEEIEDDLDDIQEDMITPLNGNRFLEAINSKDETKIKEYVDYINSINNDLDDLIHRILEKIKKRRFDFDD